MKIFLVFLGMLASSACLPPQTDVLGQAEEGPLTLATIQNSVLQDTTISAACGNGTLETLEGEQCDDGNRTIETCDYGDTSCVICDDKCQLSPGATSFCGDSIIDGLNAEHCDDGNSITESCNYGDIECLVCNSSCRLALGNARFCGDGTRQIEFGEQCDDGNKISADGCSSTCGNELCGDGILQIAIGEQCDDGNNVGSDGCSAICLKEFCGDGILQATSGEQCDDGNNVNGDGCSNLCIPDTGFCGDGILQAALGEQCDGADLGSNTCSDFLVYEGTLACTQDCKLDTSGCVGARCGDGIVQIDTPLGVPAETCDLGHGENYVLKVDINASGSSCALVEGSTIDSTGHILCTGDPHSDYLDNLNGEELSDIALGDAALCGITSSGFITCAGAGEVVAAAPLGPSNHERIESTGSAMCAIDANNNLDCWGAECSGSSCWHNGVSVSTGDGIATVSLSNASFVSGGDDVVCYIQSTDGSLVCFGNDTQNVVTTGNTLNGTYNKVSIGVDFACALTTTKALECFGMNSSTANDPAQEMLNVSVLSTGASGPYQDVVAGVDFGCVIHDDANNTVECWGPGAASNVLNGTTSVASMSVSLFVEFDESSHCMTTTSGTVLCAGDNEDGQIPSRVVLGPYTQIAIAKDIFFGVKTNGNLELLGDNSDVIGAIYETDVLDVYGTLAGACSIQAVTPGASAGRVECWTNGNVSELKNRAPTNETDLVQVRIPARGTACALRSNGAVICWGWDQGIHYPMQNEIIHDRPVNGGYVHLASATRKLEEIGEDWFVGTMCALQEQAGTQNLYCWGGDNGPLGDNSSDDALQNNIPDPSSAGKKFTKQIVGGMNFFCAIINDSGDATNGGEIVCWGNDAPGSLPSEQNFVQIGATFQTGDQYLCAVDANGQVTCSFDWNTPIFPGFQASQVVVSRDSVCATQRGGDAGVMKCRWLKFGGVVPPAPFTNLNHLPTALCPESGPCQFCDTTCQVQEVD
ncbi:MAG: DUF4215 domain-containing protein [Myxococcota bacterium]